jgi:two-component system, OmpR family, response regulator
MSPVRLAGAGVARILIVDDDPAIRDVVRFALAKAGFETIEAANGREALALFTSATPDLIVLDITMPELDGTEICRRIRRESTVPILFLSARDEEFDRVLGLELGGDDYLTKPFSPRELVARIKAVLRRGGASPLAEEPSKVLSHGVLTLDLDEVRASWNGQEVALTATEFGILRTLMTRPGKVYSRDSLMDGAYSIDKIVSDRTIDSHVRRLRAKFEAIGAAPVETLHGVGYKLGACR